VTTLGLSLVALAGGCIGLGLGGFSKGALGVGLPLVSIPILSFFMPVPQALAILTVPIFITNIWQAIHGGHVRVVIRRFWPMALALAAGIGAGAQILVRLDDKTLYLIMGLIVLTQPVMRWFKPHAVIPEHQQRWLNPMVGLVSGMVGGMSGFYGPLAFIYLAALRLPKDMFTSAAAVLLFTGGIALAIFLSGLGVMTRNDLVLSCMALVPAMAGILMGQRIRARFSQAQFERALTITMLVMGVSLLIKAI